MNDRKFEPLGSAQPKVSNIQIRVWTNTTDSKERNVAQRCSDTVQKIRYKLVVDEIGAERT